MSPGTFAHTYCSGASPPLRSDHHLLRRCLRTAFAPAFQLTYTSPCPQLPQQTPGCRRLRLPQQMTKACAGKGDQRRTRKFAQPCMRKVRTQGFLPALHTLCTTRRYRRNGTLERLLGSSRVRCVRRPLHPPPRLGRQNQRLWRLKAKPQSRAVGHAAPARPVLGSPTLLERRPARAGP